MNHIFDEIKTWPQMNNTIWITNSEVIGHLFLGGITIFVYSYAIFLCCAVYDYQDEKPEEEKCLLDYDIKDWMNSQFVLMYYTGLVQFISLFTPPITLWNFVYPVCYLGVFLFHFQCTSIFVYLYNQYVHTFQPDDIIDVEPSIYRWKNLIWKFFLTCILLSLSILCPLEDQPMLFLVLTKGVKYDRYVFMRILLKSHTFGNIPFFFKTSLI